MKRLYIHILAPIFVLCFGVTACANVFLAKNAVEQPNHTQSSTYTTNSLQNFMFGEWYAEKLIAYDLITNEHEPTPDYKDIVGETIHIGSDILKSDFRVIENLIVEKPVFAYEKIDAKDLLTLYIKTDAKYLNNFKINYNDSIYNVTIKSGDGKDEPMYFVIVNENRLILHFMNSFFEMKRTNS